MCGLSIYLIEFIYNGIRFTWSDNDLCFRSNGLVYPIYYDDPPVGSYNLKFSNKVGVIAE